MKIACGLFHDEFELSGEYQSFIGWTTAISKLGHNVIRFTPQGDLRSTPLRFHATGESLFRKWREQYTFIQRSVELGHQVDCLHLFLPSASFFWIADRIKRVVKKRVVVTCIGENPRMSDVWDFSNFLNMFRFYAVRYAAMAISPPAKFAADAYIAHSSQLLERFREQGCPAHKTHFSYPILPTEQGPDDLSKALAERIKNRPTFLFMGHFLPNKGVETLLTAFSTLTDYDAQLLLAWSGIGNRAHVESQIRRMGLDNRLILTSDPLHRETIFRSAVAIVLPFSISFGQMAPPLLLFEAFRSGIPVIVSNFPCVQDYASNRDTAFLVKPRDPRDLAVALKQVLRLNDQSDFRARQRNTYGHWTEKIDIGAIYG